MRIKLVCMYGMDAPLTSLLPNELSNVRFKNDLTNVHLLEVISQEFVNTKL